MGASLIRYPRFFAVLVALMLLFELRKPKWLGRHTHGIHRSSIETQDSRNSLAQKSGREEGQDPSSRFGVVSSCVVGEGEWWSSSTHMHRIFTPELAQLSLANKQDYCNSHPDTTCHLSTTSSDTCTSFVWEKHFALMRHLHEHEWLLWVDCDALITDPRMPLERLVNMAMDSHEIMVRSDNNFYNLGVILLRASANTSWLLREMLAMRDWMEHMQGHWQDQKAFAIILQKFPEWRNRVARVLPSHLNTYADDFQSGDFIYHEVGCKAELGGDMQRILKCRNSFAAAAQMSREQLHESKRTPPGTSFRTRRQHSPWYNSLRCLGRRISVLHLPTQKPYGKGGTGFVEQYNLQHLSKTPEIRIAE